MSQWSEAMATKSELNAAFQKADDAWGVELVKTYGKKAGDRRYLKDFNGARMGEETALGALYRARESARIAWESVAYKA